MLRADELAVAYDAARARLERIAYAILGSRGEAEDVVAETWLRLVAADAREPVRDVEAWSTVATSRAALDVARSARLTRAAYVGPWLPEPLLTAADPADRVTLDDTVRYALLVVLETLTPAERTAWVLHDLFGLPFAEVAAAVGRSEPAVRQLAARGRRHVEAHAPRLTVGPAEHARVVTAFLTAAGGGDLAGLLAVLDPGAVLTSDGAGEVSAARRPVVGADRVARVVLGIAGRAVDARTVSVNGMTGVALYDGPALLSVLAFTVSGGRVQRLDIVRAPAKLRTVAAARGPRADR